MAEYIERNSLGIGKCNPDVFEDKGYAKGWNAAIDIVQNAPAADVRPVVLCKDCKWTKKDDMDDPAIYCMKWDRWEMPPDGFCWLGQKKEGTDDEKA